MAKVAFQPIRKESISEEIAAQVRKEILQGTYLPGEKLPSERELALAFGCNRTSVREALVRLQELGLVEIRQGAGVEVLDWRRAGEVDLLVHLLTTPDAQGKFDRKALWSVIEVAQTLYIRSAELAFQRMKPEEFARVEALLEKQLTLTNDIDAFMANDGEIHRAIFEGAHSVALQLLYNTFWQIFCEYSSPFRIFFEAELKQGDKSKVISYYRKALEIVKKRDAAAVRGLISEMFQPASPELFEKLVARLTF
ncbi:MAG: GntR family transcriptional regulator [Bdellovibrionota bacterium]